MSTPQPIARAAAALSFGVVLVVLSAALLLASWYLGLTNPASDEGPGPSVPLAVVGWIALALGLPLLRVGIYRLVDHGDDAAVQREHRHADGS